MKKWDRLSSSQKSPKYRYVRRRWRIAFSVIDALGGWIFGAARWLLARLQSIGLATSEADPPADPRSILVIQLDHLGDALLSTPVFPALRRRFPKAVIEVLASPANADVFRAMHEVDGVHVSAANRFARSRTVPFAWIFATVWWGLKLRQRRIDWCLDLRGEFPHAVLMWLAGARRRAGWAAGGGGFLLTDSAKYIVGRPEIASRWALLAAIGAMPDENIPPLRSVFRPNDAACKCVDSHLAALNCRTEAGPLVVVHVGAGTQAKQWPETHWRETIGRLVVERSARVVLVGSLGDRSKAARILDGREWPQVADWTGRLTLQELGALLARCDAFVGADSGPAHLAAALGAPSVVLFSGTNDPVQWRPYGDRVEVVFEPVDCRPCHCHVCPKPSHPCMSRLWPSAVLAALDRVANFVEQNQMLSEQGIVHDCAVARD